MEQLFKVIYNRFLLRDILGYVLPGLIIISGFLLSYNNWQSSLAGLLSKVKIMNYVLLFGVAYIIGYGLSIATKSRLLCIKKFRLARDYPKEDNEEDFLQRQVNFYYTVDNDDIKSQRERYVILKLLSANNGYGLIVGLIFYLLANRIDALILGFVFIAIVSICLIREHHHIVEIQKKLEE